MTDADKPKLSPKMKILVGAISLMLGLVVGLAVAVGMFFVQMKSPDYQKSIASSIADFSSPLPAGFSLESATDIGRLKSVSFIHKPEFMSVIFNISDVKDEAEKKEMEDAVLREQSGETYVETEMQQKAVAACTLEYRTKVQKKSDTNIVTVLDGKIVGIPNRIVTVTALSDTTPFNFKLFDQLMDAIKSFKKAGN